MIVIFLNNLQNQKNQSKKKKKALTLSNTMILLSGRQKILNAFERGIFSKGKQGKVLKSILLKSLHKKLSFPLRISSVSITLTEEILNGQLHFLCSEYNEFNKVIKQNGHYIYEF